MTDRSKGQRGGETKRKTKTQGKQPGLFGGEETSVTPSSPPALAPARLRAAVGTDFGMRQHQLVVHVHVHVCVCARACVKM